MVYVYILKSLQLTDQRYIGITKDLRQRLNYHNSGRSVHTAKFIPWKIETYIAFSDGVKALEFERCLKTGAGWAFSMKRF